MKYSLFIKNEIIYYKENNRRSIDVDLSLLSQIPASDIKYLIFNSKKDQVVLQCTRNREIAIDVGSSESITDFKNEVLKCFPQSKCLDSDKATLYLIKKTLLAIIVLVFVALVILMVEPNNTSASIKSYAIVKLFEGLASIGASKVILIFGILLLFLIISILRSFRSTDHKTIIKLKTK